MRLRLRGINWVRKKLRDGSTAEYFYAWRGGPRLSGKPGSADFIDSYNRAVAERHPQRTDTLLGLLNAYQASEDFKGLAARSRRDYVKQIVRIERRFSDFPVAALSDRRSRAIFLAWRDEIARTSRRQADYAWTVLSRSLSWALDRGIVADNPCAKAGRLYRGNRVDRVWSSDDEAAFMEAAPAHLRLAFLLALWTGQRQGDLLALPWSAYDGECIRLRQSKTGARVVVPVAKPLKAALDDAKEKKVGPLVLTNSRGLPWTGNGFHASWRKVCAGAGIRGLTFNDLRGTAVTRLALAGATEAEIATISGHSLREVRSILDSNYLHRDPALAKSAVAKLERHFQK